MFAFSYSMFKTRDVGIPGMDAVDGIPNILPGGYSYRKSNQQYDSSVTVQAKNQVIYSHGVDLQRFGGFFKRKYAFGFIFGRHFVTLLSS